MKKSLIAGAGIAALGLAVVPFAGVFAAGPDDTITDNISVTVNSTCTFDKTGGSSRTVTFDDMTVGQQKTATSSLKVVCNNVSGYTVNGEFTDLTNNVPTSGTKDTMSFKDAKVAAAGDGKWSATITPTIGGTKGTAVNATSGEKIFESNTYTQTLTGDTASIIYTIGTRDNQTAGTYTGTATYTLTKKS